MRFASRFTLALAISLAAAVGSPARGQEEEEDEEDLGKPGLVVTYSGLSIGESSGTGWILELRPTFDLSAGEAPHPRVPADRFGVSWQGRINVLKPGKYVFRAEAVGRVELSIEGNVVLQGATEAGQPGSVAGTPVELKYGQVRFAARFEKLDAGSPARVRWFWRREGEFESPIPASAFNIRASTNMPDIVPMADTDRRQIVDLRCARCHVDLRDDPAAEIAAVDGLPIDRAATLDGIGDRLNEDWLYRWLDAPHVVRADAKMPDLFGETPADRADLYAATKFLASLRDTKKGAAGPAPSAAVAASAADDSAVRRRMASVGCIACHTLPGEDGAKFPGLRSLDRLGDKYRADALRQRIGDPRKFHPDSRMPDFRLAEEQPQLLDEITAYLLARSGSPAVEPPAVPDEKSLHERWNAHFTSDAERSRFAKLSVDERLRTLGRKAVEARGCAACHAWKDAPAVAAAPAITRRTASGGCLADAPKSPAVDYRLSRADREALASFCAERVDAPKPTAAPLFVAADQQRRNGCVNCHATDRLESPFAKRILSFVPLGTDQTIHDVAPPSLAGIGEKLTPKTLEEVIDGKTRARPWMALRMPHFKAEHVAGLAEAITARDGIDPRAKSSAALPSSADTVEGPSDELLETGRQLIGRTGLNCVSCHDIRGVKSIGVRGPDLANVARRIRPEWFEQWLLEPQRLAPGTRMPSVFFGGKSAAPQYLEGDPQRQLGAMWAYLAAGSKLPLPSLAPPAAAIVPGGENPRFTPTDKPLIVRGFMPGTAGMKGIAIGTPQGMHFAFDSEQCKLAAVWTGDFAEIGGWYDNGRGKPEENGLKPLGKIIWRGDAEGAAAPAPIWYEGPPRADSERSFGRPLKPRFTAVSFESVTDPGVEYVLQLKDGAEIRVRESFEEFDDTNFSRNFEVHGEVTDADVRLVICDPIESYHFGEAYYRSGGRVWVVGHNGPAAGFFPASGAQRYYLGINKLKKDEPLRFQIGYRNVKEPPAAVPGSKP